MSAYNKVTRIFHVISSLFWNEKESTCCKNILHFHDILYFYLFLIFFISVTIGCLVLHQRYQRRYARYLLLVQDVSSRELASDAEYDDDDTSPKIVHTTNINGCGTSEGELLVWLSKSAKLYWIWLATHQTSNHKQNFKTTQNLT